MRLTSPPVPGLSPGNTPPGRHAGELVDTWTIHPRRAALPLTLAPLPYSSGEVAATTMSPQGTALDAGAHCQCKRACIGVHRQAGLARAHTAHMAPRHLTA